ncbi:MAG: hypothetical protein WBQ31_20280 [Candidatus Acidiferrales bacterium]
MQGQIGITPDVRLVLEPSECATDFCHETAAIDFAGQRLCVEHFLPTCMLELESRSARLRELSFEPAATAAFRDFMATCAKQAEQLVAVSRFTHAHGKNGLLDFLLRVSQLSQRIRRSPRKNSTVAVWLRREDPYSTWQEETWTVSVSRHGAGLICHRPVQKGGTLVLCRKDKGSRAEATVVYTMRDAEGRKQIGVQFRDPTDFWDLD